MQINPIILPSWLTSKCVFQQGVELKIEGVLNIVAATVKEEIVKEALDPSKDAVIELNAANPRLTTAPTRKGLTYTLYEGHELKSLSKGDSKLGDGDSWTPTITVSGGNAAFYSIDVTK